MKPLLTRPVNRPVFMMTSRPTLIGVLDGPAQPDGSAPVLHHHGDVLELDLLELARRVLDVALVRVPALVGGLVRAPEADEVRAHDAVALPPPARSSMWR